MEKTPGSRKKEDIEKDIARNETKIADLVKSIGALEAEVVELETQGKESKKLKQNIEELRQMRETYLASVAYLNSELERKGR